MESSFRVRLLSAASSLGALDDQEKGAGGTSPAKGPYESEVDIAEAAIGAPNGATINAAIGAAIGAAIVGVVQAPLCLPDLASPMSSLGAGAGPRATARRVRPCL
jgi:hypothetical protein